MQENPLSANNGKVEQLRRLNLAGDIYVIGDGYTDYQDESLPDLQINFMPSLKM